MRRHRIHLGDDVRELDFTIGQTVYLRVRDDPVRGMVCGYYVRPGSVAYVVSWGNTGEECHHYGFELAAAFEPAYPAPAGEGQ